MKKTLAILLCLAALLSLAACGGAPTSGDAAAPTKNYTREELQQIVVQTALAYYYQNPDVQYDSIKFCEDGTSRLTSGDAPEVASRDTQIYSVCSDYMYDIYHDAFGYELMGGPKNVGTKYLTALTEDINPMVKFHFAGSDNAAEREAAMEATRGKMEPGDLVVYYAKSAGHVMMYLGDCFGDGTEYGIHCWGSKLDPATGEETYEDKGSIKLQPTEELFYTKKNENGPTCYLAAAGHSGNGLNILRPFDAPDFVPQPTAKALSRVQYLGIRVDRELDRSRYVAVENGTELAVTVSVTNNGKADYTELPVVENLPQGQTIVDGSAADAVAEDGRLSWKLTVPAGQTVTVGYKLKISGAPGESVTLPGGTVAAIETPEIPVVIGGKPMSAEQVKALTEAAKAMAKNGTDAQQTEVVNQLYRDAFGVELKLPETMEKLAELLTVADVPTGLEKRLFMRKTELNDEEKQLMKMIIPGHIGGQYFYHQRDTRAAVPDFYGFSERYQPGDILIGSYGTNRTVFIDDAEIDYIVILGDKTFLYNKKDGISLKPYNSTMGLAMKYNLFFGLRPSQAFDNLFGN